MFFQILITVAVCYLLGNHNGAVCISAMLGDDVRSHGSGNAGLTNFIRNYGAGRAAFVILIDVCKAVLACALGRMIFATLGGVSVMIGHDFPALLGFRGGKGILSGWFIAFMIDWRIGVLIGIVFFTAYFLTHYVSLGSVLAALTFAIGFVIFHHDNISVMIGGVFMGLLTTFMHRGNIVRLVKGQERKTNLFQLKKSD